MMQPRNSLDELFFATVRIEAHPESKPRERIFGTGFFVQRRVQDDLYTFLVTSHHVIRGAETGILYLIEGAHGEAHAALYPAECNHFQLAWVPHPNPRVDVAVMRVEPLLLQIFEKEGKKFFLRFLPEDQFVTNDDLVAMESIEDVIFVGYPAGVYDHANGLPIARRAITASPMFMDFEGDPAFLIDGAIRGGSSGSPVFVASSGVRMKRDGSVVGRRTHFVGVLVEMLLDPYHRLNNSDERAMLDLGVVYKPLTVSETIDEWFRHAVRHDSATSKDRAPLI
jgi:hypothetical protein